MGELTTEQLNKMFEFLRENDLVIVVKLDRLARSLKDFVEKTLEINSI